MCPLRFSSLFEYDMALHALRHPALSPSFIFPPQASLPPFILCFYIPFLLYHILVISIYNISLKNHRVYRLPFRTHFPKDYYLGSSAKESLDDACLRVLFSLSFPNVVASDLVLNNFLCENVYEKCEPINHD